MDFSRFASTHDGHRARPCFIPEIEMIIRNALNTCTMYSSDIRDQFLAAYNEQILLDKFNILAGISSYNSRSYVHGTSQAFDAFYLRNHSKRIRVLPGEFAYHSISCRSYGLRFQEVTDSTPLCSGDAFLLSVPFSASCDIPEDYDKLMETCCREEIPVLIDFAYLGISKGISISLEYSCIEDICFSLSKAYFGTERLRIGMRLQKAFTDDPIDFANEFNMYNIVGGHVGLALLRDYPPHLIYEELDKYANDICSQNGYRRNKTCIFASIPCEHELYETYKRGNSRYSRLCLSDMIRLER